MPIPYAGSSDLIPVNPMGQMQRPPLPPSLMTDPNRNRDLLNNVIDPAMEPDRGMSAMSPRDPFMASLPPRQPQAAPGGPVTTLQPSRTQPFSRADAQALHALDPRALEEARGVAALPESTPAKMTGSFGGKSFEMQPSARVDRNALAKLYAAAQERKGQERQDSVRAQEQGGKLALVEAPGKQLTDRRKMELEAEERITGKKLEADAPGRAADIAAKNAQTAAVTGAEKRTQEQFGEEFTPETKAANALYERLTTGPFAQTQENRDAAKKVFPRTSYAAGAGEEEAAVAGGAMAGPGPDIGQAAAEVMADPGIAAIIARAKETTPGVFTGGQGRQTGAAARQLAERAIRARLARSGVSPEDAQSVITSILGAASVPGATSSMDSSAAAGLPMFVPRSAIRPAGG